MNERGYLYLIGYIIDDILYIAICDMIYKILGKYIIVNKYNSGIFDNKKNTTSFGYKKMSNGI